MLDLLRPILGRVVGGIVGGLVIWLAGMGIDLDPEATKQIEAAVQGLIFAIGSIAYALAHKLVSRWINPGDAASPTLAKESKVHKEMLDDAGMAARGYELDASGKPRI